LLLLKSSTIPATAASTAEKDRQNIQSATEIVTSSTRLKSWASQAKHGMMSQTHYAFPTEPNRTMTDGVLFLQFALIPRLKSWVFLLTFY